MKLALGQINPTVGDFAGNRARILDYAKRAADGGADIAIFPELAICGYPPQDFAEVTKFLERNEEELRALARETESLGIGIIVGYAGLTEPDHIRRAANRAAYLDRGRVIFTQQKMLLPTYDVFDEWRYFVAATKQHVCEIGGQRVGLVICEDAWNDRRFWRRQTYDRDPVEELATEGIDLLIIVSASPYHMHKRKFRLEMLRATAHRWNVPIVFCNQVGGNDQLLFDGSSIVIGPKGQVRARGKSFEEDLIFYNTETGEGDLHDQTADECVAAYDALVLGLRDYFRKCGFGKAIIGLSGGIDSSLTAVIAVEAIGRENVIGVGMPGPYSSEGSVRDAREMAEKLGIRFEIISINEAFETMRKTLAPVFEGMPADVTEENLQARLRGNTLMALSNKFGALVLTTGNKSELAVGYCTLYGDMVGGLAVISDLPKSLVYRLSRVANTRHNNAIPESVFTKPPSAELRPDQKDTDSLPEYDVLDRILERYVERYESPERIADELELPLELVLDISRKVDRNEYKRKQAAPGLRVTSKAFGVGRRFPIAHRYRSTPD